MKIHQYEVARKLGISPMTVSRVLRGYSNVSPGMRAKILKTIQDLGGKHQLQKNDKSNQAPLIAIAHSQILVPVFGNWEVFQEQYGTQNLLKGLRSRLEPYQCQLILKHFQSLDELLIFLQKEPFSAVVLRQHYPEKWIDSIRSFALPIYAVAPHSFSPIDSVTHNEAAAAWCAAQHLLGLGHRQIAWFGIHDINQVSLIPHPKDLFSALAYPSTNHCQRYNCWLQFTQIQHPDLKSTLTLVPRDHQKSMLPDVIKKGLKQILKQRPRPTSLVVASEFMAYEIINQLHEKGISVPEEMSLISFGNPPFSDQTEPALTCIDLDHFGMGKTIPDLIERRRLNPSSSALSILHECHLVIRKTTAKPSL